MSQERSPILEALVADDPDMVVWWGRGRLPARGRPDVDPESHRRLRTAAILEGFQVLPLG